MKDSETNRETLGTKLRALSRRHDRSESHIEINGTNEVIVEGCRGLLEYGDERIRISTGKRAVTVTGTCLTIRNMFSQVVAIDGHISSIELY